ncbi:MAG: hypothetical protein MJ069_07700 [Salinivirgaceae bacterium]|nr:hypothetical protein [Salinivirgaceae bacterium]
MATCILRTLRKILLSFLILSLFSSCIKSLEEEGIYENTICEGTLVNNQNSKPIEGLRVCKTNGELSPIVIVSDANGNFGIDVTPEDIKNDYYLQIEADSLYVGRQVSIKEMQLGSYSYQLGVIEVQGPTLPTIATYEITDVKANTAMCGGNVTDNGQSTIKQRGVCWSTQQYPTIDDSHSVDGNGAGSFNSLLFNLKINTTYYVRAYATNGVGTAYGEQLQFTTTDGLPTIITTTIKDIKATEATTGGNVTTDGGYSVTAYGVCWSTAMQPTILNSHTNNGKGTGSFVATVTGLEANTTYYLRAYATNSVGTVYGQQITFTTTNGLPVVATAKAINVTTTTASLGGSVDSDGGFACTARGVCYSTTPNPTIANAPHTADGIGTGPFLSQLSGLLSGTTYYVRAYATNSIGTEYGEEVVFVTE